MSAFSTAIEAMTEQISVELRKLRQEERYPSHDPDKMDDTIKFHRERVVAMRRLREELEELEADTGP